MNLLDIIQRVKSLTNEGATLSRDHVLPVLEDFLGHLLRVEGPPVEPMEGLSEDYRTIVVRSPSRKALCMAHTWITGPWRCLVLDTPSVPMGRPIFLPNEDPDSKVPPRTITDSRSQTFQRRVVFACQQFQVNLPVGEGAVHIVNGSNRTFLAWRHREPDEAFNRSLRGDVDNFAKNVLDGLQSAGILPNDRGVFRLASTKDEPRAWGDPPLSLDDHLRQEATLRYGRGDAIETIRVDLHLSKAHMGRLFPEYVVRTARTRSPEEIANHEAQDAERARQAVIYALTDGLPYKEARRKAGCSGAAFQKALQGAVRPMLLEGKLTLRQLAEKLHIDTRTAAKVAGNEQAVQRAMKAAGAVLATRTKRQAGKALDRAAKAYQNAPEPKPMIPELAARFQVNPGSLTSRLQREKAKVSTPAKPKKAKKRKGKPGRPRKAKNATPKAKKKPATKRTRTRKAAEA